MDEQVTEGLVAHGILRREEQKVLWVFPAKRYPLLEDGPQGSVIERIRAVLLAGVEPEPRTRALIGLGKAGKLLKHALTRDERRTARGRIDALVAADPFVAAVAKAVSDARSDDDASASVAAMAGTL